MAEYYYHWKHYANDTAGGTPCLRLNRKSPEIRHLSAGDYVWCGTVNSSGEAALVARMVVVAAGANSPSDPAVVRHGWTNFFEADRSATDWFETAGQIGFEAVLRSLSFPVRASHVGSSLHGNNGFRRLQSSDARAMQTFASSLKPHPVIS
jgi:hypothetical protein